MPESLHVLVHEIDSKLAIDDQLVTLNLIRTTSIGVPYVSLLIAVVHYCCGGVDKLAETLKNECSVCVHCAIMVMITRHCIMMRVHEGHSSVWHLLSYSTSVLRYPNIDFGVTFNRGFT